MRHRLPIGSARPRLCGDQLLPGDRIISPSEYEHFWQVCLAMFEDQTIVQRELAIAYHAYLQGVLS